MLAANEEPLSATRRGAHAFRRAVLRGLAVVLPPLLTVVIFLWLFSTIRTQVLEPIITGGRNVLAWYLTEQVPPELSGDRPLVDRKEYVRLYSGSYVPKEVYDVVAKAPSTEPLPTTPKLLYRRYVEIQFFKPYLVIPATAIVFVLLMYFMGKFLAAGVGRVFWNLFERGIGRLPLVRSVYSSVKQVTDFMLNDSDMTYTRVVAVEYPRKGIWAIGLVTSESLLDIAALAGEAMLAVYIPGSPMPVTGYTVAVRRGEAIDLNLTIDQALQYIVSCGVVVPPHQLSPRLRGHKELASHLGGKR